MSFYNRGVSAMSGSRYEAEYGTKPGQEIQKVKEIAEKKKVFGWVFVTTLVGGLFLAIRQQKLPSHHKGEY